MLEHTLVPNTPLDFDVQFADVVYDQGKHEQFVRLKGRALGEFGVLVLEYVSAMEALKLGEILAGEPKLPRGFGETITFHEIKLRSRSLRITRQVPEPSAQDGMGNDREDVGEILTIARREFRPRSQSSVYLECVEFTLEKVVPRFRDAGIPVGDLAAAAMVHTQFINRMDRMGGRGE